MAEVLICARNATHPDSDVDRRSCYKRGDPVTVQPDGHPWGAKEGLPRFVVVKIPGVSVEQVRDVIQEQTESDQGAALTDDDGLPVTFRRRRWRVLVDNVPQQIRRTLAQTGEVTVTPAQIKNYVRRVRDNAQFEGL